MASIKLALFALILLSKQDLYSKTLASQSPLMVQVSHNEISGSYEGKIHFVIRSDFISIGRVHSHRNLVTFYEYTHDTHFLRILEHIIVRYKADEYHLPWQVPSNTTASSLRKFLRPKIQKLKAFSHLRFKRQQQIEDKFNYEETNLLVKMSENLSRSTKVANHKLIQRLHWLVKGCLRVVGLPFWTFESSSEPGLPLVRRNNSLSANVHAQSARCKDMRPKTTLSSKERHEGKSEERCFGMCGVDCWCWPWVCGDCCLHKGCFQHDTCCQHHGYASVYCFCPWVFGFNCERGYHGFPECMYH